MATDQVVEFLKAVSSFVSELCSRFDRAWVKRRRKIDSKVLLIVVFRLVCAKGGYQTVLNFLNLKLGRRLQVAASSFCEARRKIDESFFKLLFESIVGYVSSSFADDFYWKGKRIFAVDGSKVNVPKDLEDVGYPTPGYYPQALMSCLYSLKAKIPVDIVFSADANEREQAHEHLKKLQRGDVVVYDRGYLSYALLCAHVESGVYGVFRVCERAQNFTEIRKFIRSKSREKIVTIETTSVTKVRMWHTHRELKPRPIRLRLMRYKVGGTVYILASTLTDQRHSLKFFSDLYRSRWGVEEFFKVTKREQNLEVFHGHTEPTVLQEVYARMCLLVIGRTVGHILSKDLKLEKQKRRLSLKNGLLLLEACLEELLAGTKATLRATAEKISHLYAKSIQKLRPNRVYERISHKPISKWQAPRITRVWQKQRIESKRKGPEPLGSDP